MERLEKEQREAEEKGDSMATLEHRTQESKREMDILGPKLDACLRCLTDAYLYARWFAISTIHVNLYHTIACMNTSYHILDALEEIKDLNARKATLKIDDILEERATKDALLVAKRKAEEQAEDEAAAILFKKQKSESIKRLDSDSGGSDDENSSKKLTSTLPSFGNLSALEPEKKEETSGNGFGGLGLPFGGVIVKKKKDKEKKKKKKKDHDKEKKKKSKK